MMAHKNSTRQLIIFFHASQDIFSNNALTNSTFMHFGAKFFSRVHFEFKIARIQGLCDSPKHDASNANQLQSLDYITFFGIYQLTNFNLNCQRLFCTISLRHGNLHRQSA
jgi:hypothetical protein